MLPVKRTEKAVIDYVVHDFEPAVDATELRESLDTRLLVSPVVELFPENNDADLTVADAARIYRKSPRQIQRLLKSGHLTGYKMMGPKGPEWRVCRGQNAQLEEASKDEGAATHSQTCELNSKVKIMAHDLQVLILKAERFEAAIARIDNLVSKVERLQSDIQALKELTGRNESVIKELHILTDQQSSIESVSSEVRQHREVLQDLADKQSKRSWWKKAFGSQSSISNT